MVLSDLFLSQTPNSAKHGVGHKHFFSNRVAKFLLTCVEQPSHFKSDTPADPDVCASSSNDWVRRAPISSTQKQVGDVRA